MLKPIDYIGKQDLKAYANTPIETKTVDTLDSTPAITTVPTLLTTSSIPTTLATTTEISTTEATMNKGRKRKLIKMPTKKVKIATPQQFMVPFW